MKICKYADCIGLDQNSKKYKKAARWLNKHNIEIERFDGSVNLYENLELIIDDPKTSFEDKNGILDAVLLADVRNIPTDFEFDYKSLEDRITTKAMLIRDIKKVLSSTWNVSPVKQK